MPSDEDAQWGGMPLAENEATESNGNATRGKKKGARAVSYSPAQPTATRVRLNILVERLRFTSCETRRRGEGMVLIEDRGQRPEERETKTTRWVLTLSSAN